MDEFNIEKKYYIGASKNGSWSSVYTYKPRNQHFLEEKGEIFAVISLLGPRAFNAATAGNLLLDYLHETYFEGKYTSPLICLEKALVGTAKRLGDLVDNDQNVGDLGINLDITAMVIVGKIVYFVNMGQGGIYLYRGGNVVKVNSALRDPQGSGFVKSASGVIEKGDVLMLTTEQGIEAYTQDEVLGAMSEFNELGLKNKPLDDESALSILMLGVELEAPKIQMEKNEEEVKRFIKNEDEDMITETVKQTNDNMIRDSSEVKDEKRKGVNINFKDLKSKQKLSSLLTALKSKTSGMRNKIKDMKLTQKVQTRFDKIKPDDSNDTTAVYIIKRIKSNSITIYRKLKKIIWDDFLQMDQGIYLKNARRGTNWRLVGTIAVTALILIFFSTKIVSSNQEKARNKLEVQNTINKVSTEVEKLGPEINSILGVVDIYNRDKSKYQTRITQARNDLNGIVKYDQQKDKINNLISQLNTLENKLNRKVIVTNPEVIVDFATTLGENATPSDMVLTNNKIFVSDSARGVVYSLDYDGTNLSEFVKELQGPKSLTVTDDGNIIGADSNASEPFFSLNSNNASLKRLTGILSEDLDSIKQIDYFNLNGTDRVYFTKSNGAPVQYISAVGAGFAGAYDRLTDSTFSSANDIAVVDGKIYLLMPTEGAVRYNGDEKENFSIYGLSREDLDKVTKSTCFEVGTEYVVYGNTLGQSIVFITKSRGDEIDKADYVAQIVYQGNDNLFKNIKEVKVDYVTGDIFVLDGTRLIRLDFNDVRQFLY